MTSILLNDAKPIEKLASFKGKVNNLKWKCRFFGRTGFMYDFLLQKKIAGPYKEYGFSKIILEIPKTASMISKNVKTNGRFLGPLKNSKTLHS